MAGIIIIATDADRQHPGGTRQVEAGDVPVREGQEDQKTLRQAISRSAPHYGEGGEIAADWLQPHPTNLQAPPRRSKGSREGELPAREISGG